MVIIDTNIIVDHLRQKGKPNTLFEQLLNRVKKTDLAISVISIQELYSGQSSVGAEFEDFMAGFMGPVKVLPYSLEIARKAGKIAREAKGSLGFADPAIAATAIVSGAGLATLNERDFTGIEGLELFKFEKK